MASAFTAQQIEDYLDLIEIPSRWRPSAKPALDLEYLRVLHVHQISTIPYENLSLHYSEDKMVDIDPLELHRKFIDQRRGGYCMEISIFYNHMLRSLGFHAYTAGARIRQRKGSVPFGNYIGLCHIVNIVRLPDGRKFMVDVAFGGDGPTSPLPLTSGSEHRNLGSQHVRLTYSTIPEQVDQSKPLWIYQYRNGAGAAWHSYYAFAEVEFTAADFAMLNFWLCASPDSFQRQAVLAISFRREGDVITGKTMLVNDLVKENSAGRTVLVRTLRTEADRIDALERYFRLPLTDAQKRGIEGHATELGRSAMACGTAPTTDSRHPTEGDLVRDSTDSRGAGV